MPLTPDHRTLLGDALQPPPGTRVDMAVGTTYSMNLTALLIAPLSFALVSPDGFPEIDPDDGSPAPPDVDPVQLLEAVRRYAGRTTIFCQTGGIHVPTYRSILTFIEDSVIEVMPPRGGIFHPKIWALRFIDTDGSYSHRLVVLSRNLTFDRSWDTVLVLDEDAKGTIDATPAADFVRGLTGLGILDIPDSRREQVHDLASTLAGVRFAPPAPFTDGELLPIGLSDTPVWPFPEKAQRLLAISPFLTRGAITKMASPCAERTLVSRDEAFTQIGRRALAGWQPRVMQQVAETGADDPVDTSSTQDTNDGFLSPPDGLHAKTFVVDLPDETSEVTTGSANLTSSPWGGSVEFDVKLVGPTTSCGVASVLEGSTGLRTILDEFWPDEDEGVPDPSYDAERDLEHFHHQLAAEGRPTLHVRAIDDDSGDVETRLSIDLDALDVERGTITTRVWPSAIPASQARDLERTLSWVAAGGNVTPFLAVQSTTGSGDSQVTRTCVLKAELTGDIGDRQQEAMRTLLTNRDTVMRYIAFLLGDAEFGTLAGELTGATGAGPFGRAGAGTTTLALFEPLVRAAGRDGDALARIHRLVDDIQQMPNGGDLIPDGFDDLWQVVWSVHGKEQS